MSLFDSLITSVSGISAQSNQLGTIGTNIANVSTTGYKGSSAEFQTVLGNANPGSYQAGGTQTAVRYNVTAQGAITPTASSTDLAIKGNGFFVVQGPGGATAMTRAGSFVPNASGNLVNVAGYTLMGYSLQGGGSGTLVPVTVPSGGSVTIGTDGTVATVDANGNTTATYQIPLATVQSPDSLTTQDGDVYEANSSSGPMVVDSANSNGRGSINSSSLEGSTVDLATQLTNMIVAQRGYQANSQALQASSDLLSKLSEL